MHNYGECNNGSTVAQRIRIENGTYISQLNISISTGTIGRNIECFDAAANSTLVGSRSVIILTAGKIVDVLHQGLATPACTFSLIHHQSIFHYQILVK